MPHSAHHTIPEIGRAITYEQGKLIVPDTPIIPWIEGDGIGWDVWQAAHPVLDTAVQLAYGSTRKIAWMEVLAGGKAEKELGTLLPDDTIEAFRTYRVGMKGPLTTPVGGGFRSLNVALRKALDLYVCMRPVRWLPGVPSPVRNPQDVDMVVFRENTEDIYAGIEFPTGSRLNTLFLEWLEEHAPEEFAKIRFPETSGIGIKPVSAQGSTRLIRAAIQYAVANNRASVTMIHKGNIMKYTEGAFAEWGYAMAEEEFRDVVFTNREWSRVRDARGSEAANNEKSAALSQGKIFLRDVITDAALEQSLSRPKEFDVIATLNLNGDLFSDALMGQVGGLGIAPGGNFNNETGVAIFEATHGTAPIFAHQNRVNPSSLILSGELMLRHIGWHEAADLVLAGVRGAIGAKTVTFDFHRLMEDATLVKTTEFGDAIIKYMQIANI
ncbi:MAG: NADP-dependent isocitrate dehydrogenase [Anaerolineae bacterium]|jgi:isocitrate dehydrogenase|nr:NADP-dependent isocitrate dehydrogenase [Anaerolineae bacterium]